MAFLRFSRDKRGYEHFYLVEATKNRRGKTRARVLYWFRTPPGIKVGREPFDPELRHAIEAQNPGVTFDWRKINETPIPSAETERWRERRRIERAERVTRRSPAAAGQQTIPVDIPEAAEGPEEDVDVEAGEPAASDVDLSIDAAEQQADALEPTEESLVSDAASIDVAPASAPTTAPANAPMTMPVESSHRRRRRRRRRRPQMSQQPSAPQQPGMSSEPSEPSEDHEPEDIGRDDE